MFSRSCHWVKVKVFISTVLMVVVLSGCQDTTLPEVWLEGPAWERLTTREAFSAALEYRSGQDHIKLPATIKRRGGMSFSFEKYSFTLHLQRKLPLGFLPMDNDWVLNASYIDKTFMRHRLAYDLFRQMNKQYYPPNCGYVHMYYNQSYRGLYVLMERPDVSTLQIDKKAKEACIFKDPPLFTDFEKTIVPDSNNFFEQKFPDPAKDNKNPELKRLKNFLFYCSDDQFLEQVPQLFDLKNIMDWHLLLLFSNNSDGILKNFYLYRSQENAPYRIAIWDYDHSFGRDGDNELNLIRPLNPSRSILIRRLMEIDASDYPCRLWNRWQELQAANILTAKNVNNKLSIYRPMIEGEIDRNTELWPYDGKWYYDHNNFAQEIEVIAKYLELRIPQLEQYFRELSLKCR